MKLPSTINTLKLLLKNPNDTKQVFKLVSSLDFKCTVKSYNKLLKTDVGSKLIYDRKELLNNLSNKDWIEKFPKGSLGWHYNEFIKTNNFSSKNLMIMYEDVHPEITKPDQYSWLARHLANLHDVWHVLIGYGANHMGEISLLSFLYAQMKNKSYLYMIIAASIKTFMMKNKKHPYLRMFLEGYINGKKAKWLLSEDYEKMMGEQLDDVRKRLNIREPKIYLQLDARLKKNRKVELAC